MMCPTLSWPDVNKAFGIVSNAEGQNRTVKQCQVVTDAVEENNDI